MSSQLSGPPGGHCDLKEKVSVRACSDRPSVGRIASGLRGAAGHDQTTLMWEAADRPFGAPKPSVEGGAVPQYPF